MDYRPVFDKILIKEITDKQHTGLIIATATFKKGLVVAAGHGRVGVPMSVKEGQTIMYKKDDATDIMIEGEAYKLILERDCWMIKD